jgi:hypothetical protein
MQWTCPYASFCTVGQASEFIQAIPIMTAIGTGALLADKGSGANTLLNWLGQRDITAVIPPKANRKMQRSCDWRLYQQRHGIEYMVGNAKTFARLPPALRRKPAIS